jgi:hypothetical protein
MRKVLSVAIVIGVAAARLAAEPPAEPRDLGLIEHAVTRLAQLDVTVSGAKGAIQGLTAADFEVRLNDKLVPNVLVDDLCSANPVLRAAVPPEGPTGAAAVGPAEFPRSATATYLVYFDMAHLTQSGRQGSIASAREMLPKLIVDGNRAMIVVNALQLKTVVPLTSDLVRLDAALVTMIDDVSTFDPYGVTESLRLAEIVNTMGNDMVIAAPVGKPTSSGQKALVQTFRNLGSVQSALRLARRYAADERFRQERDLRRLSMVLGRFADLDPPKAVLYFADTMRQNAGAHYLSFFGATNLTTADEKASAEPITVEGDTGALALDRVINDAAALGIRFYTIEGQGMTGESSPIEARGSASNDRGGGSGNQAPVGVNSQHVRDAQNTMVSLAGETGGRAFLNGVAPNRMAGQIVGDLSCVYLLSFDPRGFPQDTPLAVAVAVKKPKVKTMVRGRLVVQSDSFRLTGRVLSAFASPAAGVGGSDASVNVGVIPISYEAGKFKARVQVTLAGSAVPTTTWDIGASVVSRGAVRQDGSGRIQVTLPNTPVVFEQDMVFAPGEYDLVAVAHEIQTDTVVSTEIHGTWPKADADLASLGPIAVTQRRAGGFLRNGERATQGAVLVAADELLRADLPTAVIALICRAKDQERPLRVVRTLIGATETPVGASDLDLTTEHCVQVVDLMPRKVLGAGRYRFVVTVWSDGQELTRGERAIMVAEPAQVAAVAPPASAP